MGFHGDGALLVHVCFTLLAAWGCVVCLWALIRGDLPTSLRARQRLFAPGLVLVAATVGAVALSWS
jgi:hypothetical protein